MVEWRSSVNLLFRRGLKSDNWKSFRSDKTGIGFVSSFSWRVGFTLARIASRDSKLRKLGKWRAQRRLAATTAPPGGDYAPPGGAPRHSPRHPRRKEPWSNRRWYFLSWPLHLDILTQLYEAVLVRFVNKSFSHGSVVVRRGGLLLSSSERRFKPRGCLCRLNLNGILVGAL